MIIFETASFYVWKKAIGHYEVYRNGITSATRCSVIHFSNDDQKALTRAMAECNRRQREKSEDA